MSERWSWQVMERVVYDRCEVVKLLKNDWKRRKVCFTVIVCILCAKKVIKSCRTLRLCQPATLIYFVLSDNVNSKVGPVWTICGSETGHEIMSKLKSVTVMFFRTLAPRMWFFIVVLCCVIFTFYFQMRVMRLEDSKHKLGN